jgi:hypothetical protein
VCVHLENARGHLAGTGSGAVENALVHLESAVGGLQQLVERGAGSLSAEEMDSLAAQLKGLTVLAAHGVAFWKRLGAQAGVTEEGFVERQWEG